MPSHFSRAPAGLCSGRPGLGGAGQAKFLRTVSDFTLGRIEQFDARIRDCVAERERRRGACQEAIAAIGALWDCLGVTESAVPPHPAHPAMPPARRRVGTPRELESTIGKHKHDRKAQAR